MNWRMGVLGAIAALVLVLFCASAAQAKPRVAGIFDLSGQPGQIVGGWDPGTAWVLVSGSADGNLARIDRSGTITYFEPAALVNPTGLGNGEDGHIWATRNGGVVRVPVDDPNSAQDFSVPAITSPQQIVPGPNDSLWTASNGDLISIPRNDPSSAVATPVAGMVGARGITAAAGRLFVADFAGEQIVRRAPGGATKFFDLGPDLGPQAVARGSRGQVAFTNQGTDPDTVGLISGNKTRVRKVAGTDPFGITYGLDGNYWVANFLSHDLTVLSPKGKTRRLRGLPANSGPRYLAASGPFVWVALEGSDQIARVRGVLPIVRITKGPRGTVKATGKRTAVRFKFRVSFPGFPTVCSLGERGAKQRFRPCTSPARYKLKRGSYRFAVRAQGDGIKGRAAKRSFKLAG